MSRIGTATFGSERTRAFAWRGAPHRDARRAAAKDRPKKPVGGNPERLANEAAMAALDIETIELVV
jgi:hypothetical protein